MAKFNLYSTWHCCILLGLIFLEVIKKSGCIILLMHVISINVILSHYREKREMLEIYYSHVSIVCR